MTRKLFYCMACFLLLVFMGGALAHAQKSAVTIAVSNDFPPFSFVNSEGAPAGMFVDIWRRWSEKTGQPIRFIVSDWQTSIENVKTGKADFHSGLVYTKDRSEWMMGGMQPLYQAEVRFMYPLSAGKVATLAGLTGETVTVVSGSVSEEYLRRNFPGIKIMRVPERSDLVRASREAKTKGFFVVSPVGHTLIDQAGLTGEYEKNGPLLLLEDFHPGIPKGEKALAELVDKGLRSIPVGEMAKIESRWLQLPSLQRLHLPGRVDLTAKEQAWLQTHRTIRVGMSPVLPPLKFLESGEIKGIEPDFLQYFAEQTGITFEFVTMPFTEMDARLKAGELDMFLSFNIPERLDYASFTKPFMDFRQVIIARSNAPFIGSLAELSGKRVATIKGVKLHEKLLRPYPAITPVPCDTMEQAFRTVATGRADALVSKTFFAGYLLNHFPDMKIAGVLDTAPEPYLYAVRKDYPELVSILNKAIAATPPEKRDAILQKWHSVRVEYRPNWSHIRPWLLATGGVVLLVGGLTLYWNRRLARELVKQQRAEQAARASEVRLRSYFDQSIAGIAITSPEQGWLEVNDRICTMLGYSREELLQKTWAELTCPEDLDADLAQFGRVLSGEIDAYTLDKRFIRNNGDLIWTKLSVRAVRHDHGALNYCAVVLLDINDLVTALDELWRSAEWHRTILKTAMDGFLLTDGTGRLLEVNDAYCRMSGYSESELLTMSIADLELVEDRAAVALHMGNVRTVGEDCFETKHRHKDGHTIDIDVSVQYRSDHGGRFIVFIRDISERKRLIESLWDANENLEKLFTHANAPIIVWDAQLRITRFNRAFEKLTGRTAAAVVGEPLQVLFPKERIQNSLSLINRAMEGEYLEKEEIPILHADGSTREVLWNSATIYAADNRTPLATIAQGHDISELRRYIIAERIRNERARIREEVEFEERSRLSRDLHDGCGQSLQAITLHLNLLAAGKLEDRHEGLAMLLREMSDAADELRDIARQIRPSYLREVSLDTAMEIRCTMLRRRGVPVSFESSGDFSGIPFPVSDHCYRIFQEAFANAVRHANAARIRVELVHDGGRLRLTIADDGSGMGENRLIGGIGLMIMKERAELIGASLDIASSPAGTAITVTLENV